MRRHHHRSAHRQQTAGGAHTPQRHTVTLPVSPASVTLARRTAQMAFTAWGLPRASVLMDTALLVATELVTNSVRHATGSPHLDLTVGLSTSELTVGVHDEDPTLPPWPPETRYGRGRRGLAVLTALVTGFNGRLDLHPDPYQPGKTLTATLPRHP